MWKNQCQVNMSVIVSGIENSTIGLLCCKLRDYTAQKLEEGDIDDSQCRQIIVRELDDIKTKLDGLSRKDLLASLSFFKEGVTRLYISLETYQGRWTQMDIGGGGGGGGNCGNLGGSGDMHPQIILKSRTPEIRFPASWEVIFYGKAHYKLEV